MFRTALAGIAFALASCQFAPPTDSARSEVMAAGQAWAAAFNACDAPKAAALYLPDAVLWGTTAPVLITTPSGVRQYFERVCASGSPPKVSFGEQVVRVFGDTAVNSGSYAFAVVVQGQPRSFPARYSFVYRMVEGRWLIADHHSSAVPASPPAASAPSR